MRVKGWEAALNAAVAKHRAAPFQWGASDCFMLPFDAIVAVTGVDPWPGAHAYDGRLGATRCLVALGYRSIADAFADRFPEIDVPFAQRGDVGVVESDGALCGALFLASGVVGKAEQGVVTFGREQVLRAFRVE